MALMHFPPPKIIYTLGPEGTFSDMAAGRLAAGFPDPKPSIRLTHNLAEAVALAERDSEGWGVVPIENSVAGTVGQAQETLARHRVVIEREIILPVRFALLARGPAEEAPLCFAHPQAADQCSDFMARRLPKAATVFTASNVESGRRLLALPKEEAGAAIVPLDYGKAHPDLLVGEDIQDYSHNTTRFLAVRQRGAQEQFDFTRRKTSIFVEPEEDRVGLLLDLLNIFKKHHISLTRLESHPARNKPWVYVFFMDFTNNPQSPACLEDLHASVRKITVLGSYDTLE
ncbi:MAG: ACT domain-containing protein [Deltaproteobacteria bacterium]|nr:ACT domain-containing protein [Deltaproteobacteria bacterium]